MTAVRTVEERLHFAIQQLALIEVALMADTDLDVTPEGYHVPDCAAEAVRTVREILEPLRSAPFAVMNWEPSTVPHAAECDR